MEHKFECIILSSTSLGLSFALHFAKVSYGKTLYMTIAKNQGRCKHIF